MVDQATEKALTAYVSCETPRYYGIKSNHTRLSPISHRAQYLEQLVEGSDPARDADGDFVEAHGNDIIIHQLLHLFEYGVEIGSP